MPTSAWPKFLEEGFQGRLFLACTSKNAHEKDQRLAFQRKPLMSFGCRSNGHSSKCPTPSGCSARQRPNETERLPSLRNAPIPFEGLSRTFLDRIAVFEQCFLKCCPVHVLGRWKATSFLAVTTIGRRASPNQTACWEGSFRSCHAPPYPDSIRHPQKLSIDAIHQTATGIQWSRPSIWGSFSRFLTSSHSVPAPTKTSLMPFISGKAATASAARDLDPCKRLASMQWAYHENLIIPEGPRDHELESEAESAACFGR